MMTGSVRVMQQLCRHTFNYHKAGGFKGRRFINFNSNLHVKMYQEYENDHAYSVMQTKKYVNAFDSDNNLKILNISSDEFQSTIQENWLKKAPVELFEAFSFLGNYSSKNSLCISNQIFDSFIDALTDNIKHASDVELKSLFYYLHHWPETDSVKTRNFIEVWVALDDECNKRSIRWSHDENLAFVSLFYMLKVTRISDFVRKVLNKMATKAKQLSPSQIVQTMFFIGTVRKAPFDMHNLEIQIEKLFEELSVDDMAIVSLGFFKSSTPIRSPVLLFKIIDKVSANSKTIHEMSLSALLKVLRYSYKNMPSPVIYNLLDTLKYEVSRLSVMTNLHIALLGASTLTLHKECLEQIAELTINSIAQTRLKDLERLVMTFGILNFIPDSKDIFDSIMNELRKPDRIPEIEKHARSFACCVSYLGLLGIYPIDLMNKALSPEFLSLKTYKYAISYGREVLVIHNTAKLFYPESEMNRLDDKTAKLLAKKYTDYVPSEDYSKQYNFAEKLFIDVVKNLIEDRGGKEYVIGDHILTHHQRGDIIMSNDTNGLPVKIHEHFSSSTFGKIRERPDSNIWIVLILAGRNAIIHNTGNFSGPIQAKTKELKCLGYHTNVIRWSFYNGLKTNEEKKQYLNNLIKEAIAQGTGK